MNALKVFISYSRDDADWVCKFAEALREQSVDVWLDTWQVRAGESLRDALEAGLRGSDAIVAILSAANDPRPDTLFELGVALGTGKRWIPIVPDDLDAAVIPYALRTRRSVTKGPPDETARKVAKALGSEAA